MKRLWENYAVYFHITGFIILVVFMSGNYWSKWQAQAADIDDLKGRMTRQEIISTQVVQKLDDIMAYLHVPQRRY